MEGMESGGNSGAAPAATGGASPAPQTQSTATDAGSAVQSTQPTGITDSAEREGFIPRARFDEVNTRMSAAEKALNEYRAQHGWAETIQRDQVEQMADWYGRYRGDAGEFMETILQESLADPIHGPGVRSRLGRMLSSLRAQQPPDKIEPGIPVMNERGEIVAKTYTDAQLEQLMQQKLDAALNPFKQDLESRNVERKRSAERQQQYDIADQHVAYVKALPLFEQHKEDIRTVFAGYGDRSGKTLLDAYHEVLATKILPNFSQKAEASVLSDLKTKANAQTVNPGAPSGSGKPSFKSFGDSLRYYDKHPEEAEAAAHR